MTQSGQGEQPSAREAREGIVLPSDGGEPLLPGQTGGHGGPQPGYGPPQQGGYGGPPQEGGYGSPPQAGPPGPAADPYAQPPGGQAWGNPWGPGGQQGQQQDQDQDQTQQPQAPDWSQPPAQTWGTPQQPGGIPPQPQSQAQPQSQPQPAPGYDTDEPTSYYLPPVGQPLPSAPRSQPLPPQQGQVAPYEAPGTDAPPQQGTQGHHTDEPTSYYLPPVGQPLPPADEGATQFIPPVPAAPASPEGATQYLPPVRPGALPPEVSAEAARFPGQYPQAPYGAQPPQHAAPGPDAEATQFIAPVPGQAPGASYGGDRQPPSDFDNLFRGGPGGDGGADATQQMPRFAQPGAVPPAYGAQQPSYGAQQPSYGAQQPSYGAQPPYGPPGGEHYDDGDRGGRKRSRVPVIAAVGIGIVVLGIGAGALLAGGGGGAGGDKNQTVSATAPATDGSSSPAADPAKAQAVELDKLLADSGNSRSSVISAVANVKSCKNLGQAAADLRDAASQRTGLVTRLKTLEVDRLPGHAELTDALTKAWQASASADSHYAAWADQAAGKKGCKKGQARTTGQTQAGNRDSGTASTEKAKASRLWNAIAKKYSLTERTATQL